MLGAGVVQAGPMTATTTTVNTSLRIVMTLRTAGRPDTVPLCGAIRFTRPGADGRRRASGCRHVTSRPPMRECGNVTWWSFGEAPEATHGL